MNVRTTGSALVDLAEGRLFYERQAVGLGAYFFNSVFDDIDALARTGGVHVIRFGYFRALAKTFPYAIYYKIIDDEVVVVHVLDCRRDPDSIAKSFN